ncbi:D-xylose 1-dehydrogenase Gfo6 [Halopiger xanaduensis]|uniref:Glucose-fructose oxidoreductase n=1 Tax=Halopiger xanaduensis (strain DSM 18323 / JCM 14033 / SH-6) TaxID=797210 RepID=F8DCB6_HALXS|nr:D-xylose 1-dehydrogenase Gfo6 [Halopiger xanaduensis]AEH38373.1 Glucose-fructose oxidoreductase [Halopiger xanaduensis SH-6]
MGLDDVRDYLESFTHRDWQASADDDGVVRFALVGLGWWTKERAMPAIENSTFCETTVVVSRSAEKAQRVAAEHDAVEAGLSSEEFHDGAAADAYDAVYVCTPNARHLEFVESAAARGKAVLCEKPMEATLERAERLADAAADVPAMIAYRMHTEPAVRRARELVREGAIGDPVHVHGNMSQSITGWGPDQWRLDPDLAGPGTSVTDLGIYPLNTTRFVLESDPVAVQSMMDSSHEYFEDVPDEVAAFNVTFEDGTLASCTASQHSQLDSFLKIVGSDGRLCIEPAFHSESSLRATVGETTIDIETPQVDQMEEEFDYFADCVLDDRSPHATPEHGLVDMQAIEAIYDAAEGNETRTL